MAVTQKPLCFGIRNVLKSTLHLLWKHFCKYSSFSPHSPAKSWGVCKQPSVRLACGLNKYLRMGGVAELLKNITKLCYKYEWDATREMHFLWHWPRETSKMCLMKCRRFASKMWKVFLCCWFCHMLKCWHYIRFLCNCLYVYYCSEVWCL